MTHHEINALPPDDRLLSRDPGHERPHWPASNWRNSRALVWPIGTLRTRH